MPTPGFYAVKVGRAPGIYNTWDECREQVLGFSFARFKKFRQIEDAQTFIHQPPQASGSAQVEQNPEVVVKPVHIEDKFAKNGSMDIAKVMEVDGEDYESPLAVFFAQYTNFEYDSAASATDEFYRLCDLYGWDGDDQEKQLAKQCFQDALTVQFNNSYGTDVDDLTNWQALCAKLGMDPVPERLNACRKAVRRTHVNLIDLVDIFDTPKKAHVFPSVVALSEYTKMHGKFFPRDNINAGDLLNFLLRQIMNPALSWNKNGPRGRGGRRVHRPRETK